MPVVPCYLEVSEMTYPRALSMLRAAEQGVYTSLAGYLRRGSSLAPIGLEFFVKRIGIGGIVKNTERQIELDI